MVAATATAAAAAAACAAAFAATFTSAFPSAFAAVARSASTTLAAAKPAASEPTAPKPTAPEPTTSYSTAARSTAAYSAAACSAASQSSSTTHPAAPRRATVLPCGLAGVPPSNPTLIPGGHAGVASSSPSAGAVRRALLAAARLPGVDARLSATRIHRDHQPTASRATDNRGYRHPPLHSTTSSCRDDHSCHHRAAPCSTTIPEHRSAP